MKKIGIIFLVLAVIAVIIVFSMLGRYNKIVGLEESVTSAWAQVENTYQRRADLIPNLVSTVKGYAAHERGTLNDVVNARAKLGEMKLGAEIFNDPQAMANFQKAQGAMSSALSRLLVVVERYPDLKASQNFLTLQSQLEGTENRITVERRRFNEAARAFNTTIRTFPNVFIAGAFDFEKKAYFEAQEGADIVPPVEF
jgi:LemA protein